MRDLIKRFRETGEVKPRAYKRGVKPKIRGAAEEAVRKWVQEVADLTLNELCQRYQAAFNQKISKSALDRTLKRLALTRKKKTFQDPQRQSERVQARWAESPEKVAAYPPAQRIYLDEMGAALNLVLEYGRAPQGERIST